MPTTETPIVVVEKLAKPGYKTTEFWVTLLTQAAIVATALQGALSPEHAVYATAFSQAAYAIARGLAKSKTA